MLCLNYHRCQTLLIILKSYVYVLMANQSEAKSNLRNAKRTQYTIFS